MYKQHADWLFEKREVDKATDMYKKTIGTFCGKLV